MAVPAIAIIIGAQKAGSTSLFRYLAPHPDIAPAHRKEPNFFRGDEACWERGWDAYVAGFERSARTRILLEASVAYTKGTPQRRVVERMAGCSAAYQFIYLVRDPIARIESHLTHAIAAGWPLARADLSGPVDPYVLDVCRYADHADLFANAFGRDALLVLAFDELKEDPRKTAARACRFLSLDPAPLAERSYDQHNRSLGKVRPTLAGRIVAPVARSHVARRLVPAHARDWLKTHIFGRPVRTRVRLTDAQRQQVAAELGPSLLDLEQRYNIDTSQWPTRRLSEGPPPSGQGAG